MGGLHLSTTPQLQRVSGFCLYFFCIWIRRLTGTQTVADHSILSVGHLFLSHHGRLG